MQAPTSSPHLSELRSALHARDFDELLAQLSRAHADLPHQDFAHLLGYVYASLPRASWVNSPKIQRFLRQLEPWKHPSAAWLIVYQERYSRLETLRFDDLAHSTLSWPIFNDIPRTRHTERDVSPLLDAMPHHWIVPLLEHIPAWRAPILSRLCAHTALTSYLPSDDIATLCSRLLLTLLEDPSCHEHASSLFAMLAARDTRAWATLHHTITHDQDVLRICLALPPVSQQALLDTLGFRHVRMANTYEAPSSHDAPLEDLDHVVTALRSLESWEARRDLLCAQNSSLSITSMSDAQWQRVMLAIDHAPRHEERLRLISLLYKHSPGASHVSSKILRTIRPWREDGSNTTSRASHRRRRGRGGQLHANPSTSVMSFIPYDDYEGSHRRATSVDYATFLSRFRRKCASSKEHGRHLFGMTHVNEQCFLDHLDELPEHITHLALQEFKGDLDAIHALYTSPRVLAMTGITLTLEHHPTQYTGYNLLEQHMHNAGLHRHAMLRAEQALMRGYSSRLCATLESWLDQNSGAQSLNANLHDLPDACARELLERVLAHPNMRSCTLQGMSDPIALLEHIARDPRASKLETLELRPSERAWRIYDEAAARLTRLFEEPHHIHPMALPFWAREYDVMQDEEGEDEGGLPR